MANKNFKIPILTSSLSRTTFHICVVLGFIFFSLNTSGQTVLLDPNGDGGFDDSNNFNDMGWRVTNDPDATFNQWVSSVGATPGFTGRNCAYVTNTARFDVPLHKYSASPERATHIYRDISVPVGETDIAVNFIWVAEGQEFKDFMRIWIVPITYLPTYGTEITAATDRIQLGSDYFGSSSWNSTPTLYVPESYAGSTFRFVVEWVNDSENANDPPAGIDDISIISETPPPPVNDLPCNAIELFSNTSCNYQTFSNADATDSRAFPNPGCANYRGADVWFRFTVPASGGFIIDTQDQDITNSGMAIYSGTCSSLVLIECDDDDSRNGLMSSIIKTGLTPGDTIFIRVWSYDDLNSGDFGICITPPPPPPTNDECTDAVGLTVNPSLICNAVTFGTTANATASPQPDDVTGTPDNDVWFSFIATNTTHQISLLDIIPITGTNVNLAVGVYNSSSGTCSTLTRIASRNPNVFSINNLAVGDTYYLRVYGYESGINSAQVVFNICVSTPVDPPVNDNCENAIRIPILPVCDYETYTNAGATDSSGIPNPGCGNYQGGDVWFYAIIDNTGEITIDTQNLDMTNGALAIYRGSDCSNLTLMDCDDDSSANGQMPSVTAIGLNPGERIYIRMWERGNNNNGTFGICASSPTSELTVDASIPCPGESSEDMFATFACSGTTSLGSTLSGILTNSDPIANQPIIFISSEDPCEFDPVNTANYSVIDFTVTTSGDYVFNMNTPSPYFDAMGYIVVNDGNFIPGSCASGTYIAGDDDDGPALNPQIRASLIAGTPYRLITTEFGFSNTTHVGPYRWEVIGPPADVEWFANETGGSPIGTGVSFDPIGVSGSGLVDTNTPGIHTFWVNCPGSNAPRIKAEFTIGKIWKGTVDNDWNNSNNWKPIGKPVSSDCVYIDNEANQPILAYPGAPVPPAPAYAKSVSIGNDAILELTSGTAMTITDEIDVVSTGTLLVRDNVNLVQITNVVSNNNRGNIKVQRTVPGTVSDLDYIYWSSPVENFNVTNISPGTNPSLIYKWIPTIPGNGLGNYGNWEQTNEIMDIGKGYIVRGLSGTNPLPPTPGYTTEFTGVPSNGIINIPILRGTYSGADYPGSGSSMATEFDDNWNLIGNPYPSSISAQRFILANADELFDDDNPAISGTIYLWRHLSAPSDTYDDPFYYDFAYNYNANDYIKYNLTGSSPAGFSGYIASGQSFFVLMDHNTTSPTETIQFDNLMRDETYRNDQFYRTTEEPEHHRIWLDLIAENNYATSILVGYIDGATDGNDRLYDGIELNESNNRFYSLIDLEKMSIQGKALPFLDTDTIPLGFEVAQNGNYSIAINTLDGLFETTDQNIYLEDTLNGIIHDLRLMPYSFYAQAGEQNSRFILRYRESSLSVDEEVYNNMVTISVPDGKNIHINSNSELINSVSLFDLLGREIVQKSKLDTTTYIINNQSFSNGVYLVNVIMQNGRTKTQKVILKN